ncbi:MAG: class I SAM-dependent methyltransferase, partial [Anaerolineae bacterium]
MRLDMHEQNRRSWNYMTAVHNRHKLDQAGFLRSGGTTLFPEELELLGDIHGKRLVHLQCNSGQDSLCLARLGAQVTGVDISDEAICFARQLSLEAEIPAEFVRADIYDWFTRAAEAGEKFDLAFSSYGFKCWLSDLKLWAQGIKSILAPGGRLVLVEFHPFLSMLDEHWQLAFPYFAASEPAFYQEGIGDYVAMS